jgi:hypothetical protein
MKQPGSAYNFGPLIDETLAGSSHYYLEGVALPWSHAGIGEDEARWLAGPCHKMTASQSISDQIISCDTAPHMGCYKLPMTMTAQPHNQ